MKKHTAYVLILLFFFTSCKKDDEKKYRIFDSDIGTKWIYSSYTDDTIYWQISGHKLINGVDCSELSVTGRLGTTKYYLSQSDNKIYLHAQLLPKGVMDINNMTATDTLIVLSSPSIEYVLTPDIGFKWEKKVLISQSVESFKNKWIEKEITREVVGHEVITTSVGNFDCVKIRDYSDSSSNYNLYVSKQGFIKSIAQTEQNGSIIYFVNLLIEKR